MVFSKSKLRLLTSQLINQLSTNWRIYLAGMMSMLIIISIVFAIPVKKASIESTVTYFDTQIINEPYVELEPYLSYNDSNIQILINDYYKVVPNGTRVPFTIQKSNSRIIGHYENTIPGRFAILGIGERVLWETMGSRGIFDLILQPGEYKVLFKEDVMWGEDCYIFLAVQWAESEPVTEYREVVKFREVSVSEEKQEIVITEIKISVWEYLFWKSPSLKIMNSL